MTGEGAFVFEPPRTEVVAYVTRSEWLQGVVHRNNRGLW